MNDHYVDPAGPPRTRGWWPLGIGLVCLLILAPGCLGLGIWTGVRSGLDALQHGRWTASAPQRLEASTRYVLLASRGTADQIGAGARCGALDPSGQFIRFVSSSGSTIDDDTEAAAFTSTTAGSYRLDCGDASFRVATQSRIDGLGHDIGIPVLLGFAGAAVFGLLGLALVIFAIVRLVSSSGERRRWTQSGAPNQW
ncbi:hypothetical protein [Allobranchiibius sp. GilTou38]|uniref:hypothetical protein n=1 Tax=Allobranchiibius sp. GilTou38 TaxID=2815210 RepID=UPI001AA0E0D8|nr:hypothetical protein [Allobranchiibius sp. GilTou38]MBO1766007.1 hypothetical protein [Allobranchiibius sp. GilTou38]